MPPRQGNDTCLVSLDPLPDRDALAPVWRDLEGRSDSSVFLSWAWIGSLVPLLPPRSLLLKATEDGALVGLALLGCPRDRRLPFGRSFHLNETGDRRLDRLAVEYNGVLAQRGRETEVMSAVLAALTTRGEPAWRSLYLSGVSPEWIDACRASGFALRAVRFAQPAPFADFSAMAPGDPLSSLSSNSRQQIRRSLRFFAKRGELTLHRATDVGQALDWFREMETLHVRSWRERGKPGAFTNAVFGPFHRDLISHAFDQGVPDLLCARAGRSVIGYLYNFRWRGTVDSYQSGFHYENDPDCRPGLISHLLAMRLYREEGMARYRFLAGDARYKRSLANAGDELHWVVLSRSDIVYRLGSLARGLRGLVKGQTKDKGVE